jgi:hypothetical protein
MTNSTTSTTSTRSTDALESVRVAWSAADEAFFKITAELFSPAYAQGAGVLLASYDPEPAPPDPGSAPRVPAQRAASAATAPSR